MKEVPEFEIEKEYRHKLQKEIKFYEMQLFYLRIKSLFFALGSLFCLLVSMYIIINMINKI